MEYSEEEKAYRNKLITEIETMVAQVVKDTKEDEPKLRLVK
jgi:predicted secreted protein